MYSRLVVLLYYKNIIIYYFEIFFWYARMTLLKKTLTYDMLLFIELVRVYNTGSRDTHNNYISQVYIYQNL